MNTQHGLLGVESSSGTDEGLSRGFSSHRGEPAKRLCACKRKGSPIRPFLELQKLAALDALTGQLKRPAGLAARYSGEDFAVLLPDTCVDGALQLAEGCRSALDRLALPHPASPHGVAKMSVGLATSVPGEQLTPSDLVARADAALYEAKRCGRNQVAAAPA